LIQKDPDQRLDHEGSPALISNKKQVELFESTTLTGCKSDFADHDPAQVELERETDGASDASRKYWNDDLARGLAGSVRTVMEDQWTLSEVDAADAEVEFGRLEHAHVARIHVVGVNQNSAEVAQLKNKKQQHQTVVILLDVRQTVFQQEGPAVASIARDDPSTLPGDDPFPRARMHRDRNAR